MHKQPHKPRMEFITMAFGIVVCIIQEPSLVDVILAQHTFIFQPL